MNNFKLTNNAAIRIKELQKNEEIGSLFRISVLGGGCSGFQYDFSFTKKINDDDITFCDFDVNYLIDKTSIEFIKEGSLDFVQELGGSFFKIENPNSLQIVDVVLVFLFDLKCIYPVLISILSMQE